MSVIKAFFISFSIYSKIPVPQFEWKEQDMKYTLCFFPLIGLVIGAIEYFWYLLTGYLNMGNISFCLIATAIPVLITGGFHVDGYMDTVDAMHSYQSMEKKLEILKDPHIGAFSVIMVILYYLLNVAGYSEITSTKSVLFLGGGYTMARICSGISVISFPPAKKNGMLVTFSNTAQKR